jgi:hypothetical protein
MDIVLTFVSVCMISTAQVYTATFALDFLVTSPSTWRLKTIPCTTSELPTPEPCQAKHSLLYHKSKLCIATHGQAEVNDW